MYKNTLDEIINYLLGCRGRLKYFFRALISKQHVWCMWNISCGDYFIYQVPFSVMSVCLLLSQISYLSALLCPCILFWSIKSTRGHIFDTTSASVEASLQAHSEKRTFWNMHFSGIWIWKNFGMIHPILEVCTEGASLIFRISFERKIQPHLGCCCDTAHQLCNTVRYFSICQACNLMSYTWNKPELMKQSVSLWLSQNWLVKI